MARQEESDSELIRLTAWCYSPQGREEGEVSLQIARISLITSYETKQNTDNSKFDLKITILKLS